MARPSKYNFELCKEVCDQVAKGKNIRHILDSKDEYPTFQTWCNWKREHNELFDLYTKSIHDKSESVDAKIDEIWEGCRLGQYDPATARVLIDTLKWKAAKYYPKMFGDKIDHTTDGKEMQTNIIVNLGSGKDPNETTD